MKKNILIIQLLIFPITIFAQNIEQNVLSSGGDYMENDNGNLSWTLGETITEVSNENILSQGFQQGNIWVETSLENINIDIVCYPNPTTDIIKLKLNNADEKYSYKLYSAQGNLLESEKLNKEKEMSFKKYPSGSYILSIINAQKEEKQFTILKY